MTPFQFNLTHVAHINLWKLTAQLQFLHSKTKRPYACIFQASVCSLDIVKDSVQQSTGAIQELRHELATLKNKVIQSLVAEGNKNGDEFLGSEQSKHSFNSTREQVPCDATTPQTRLPSQHLNTQDSIQQRLSYLEGKVESISEMFKFLIKEKRRNDMLFTEIIAKRQCQCNNDFEKKASTRRKRSTSKAHNGT